ncbi:MAG: hypothetical protein OYG32_04820 [Rhodospirillaceae bacterium]|nr:hypothetical protein [Rhodospirillaceae bacterium]
MPILLPLKMPAIPTIDGLAHALAQLPRWLGRARDPNTGHPLSVAQHSVWCALTVAELPCRSARRPETIMAALLHDGHEAWIGDLPATVAKAMPLRERLNALDRAVESAAASAAGWDAGWIGRADRSIVHAVDQTAAAFEAATFGTEPSRGIADACRRRAETAWREAPATRRALEAKLLEAKEAIAWPAETAAARFRDVFGEIAELKQSESLRWKS